MEKNWKHSCIAPIWVSSFQDTSKLTFDVLLSGTQTRFQLRFGSSSDSVPKKHPNDSDFINAFMGRAFFQYSYNVLDLNPDTHLAWFHGQLLVPLHKVGSSSDSSSPRVLDHPQSFSPSQTQLCGIHLRVSKHWNCSGRQFHCSRHSRVSSLPSLQSWLESHRQ